MTFYSEMAEMAKQEIEENGRPVILRRNIEGAYNAITGTFTGASTVDTNVTALFTSFEQHEIDGTVITRTDEKVLIAAASLTSPPDQNDILVDGDVEYKVIPIKIVKPGDTDIIYKIGVRK